MNRNLVNRNPTYEQPASLQPQPQSWIHDCPWGGWKMLNEGDGFRIKLLEVNPGHRLSLQYHRFRSEFWVVVAGRVHAIVDGQALELVPQQSVLIPRKAVHRLGNSGSVPALVVEVQYGNTLSEDDIVRLEDDYGRMNKVSTR